MSLERIGGNKGVHGRSRTFCPDRTAQNHSIQTWIQSKPYLRRLRFISTTLASLSLSQRSSSSSSISLFSEIHDLALIFHSHGRYFHFSLHLLFLLFSVFDFSTPFLYSEICSFCPDQTVEILCDKCEVVPNQDSQPSIVLERGFAFF